MLRTNPELPEKIKSELKKITTYMEHHEVEINVSEQLSTDPACLSNEVYSNSDDYNIIYSFIVKNGSALYSFIMDHDWKKIWNTIMKHAESEIKLYESNPEYKTYNLKTPLQILSDSLATIIGKLGETEGLGMAGLVYLGPSLE